VRLERPLAHHAPGGFGYEAQVAPFAFAGWDEPVVTRTHCRWRGYGDGACTTPTAA